MSNVPMQSFEEQFPRLVPITMDKVDRYFTNRLYFQDEILEFCLDKQKVREAIDKVIPCDCTINEENHILRKCENCKIWKELGL
jgi:hypothetical protein